VAGPRNITERLKITAINLKIRLGIVLVIELFYMAISRLLYAPYQSGKFSFAVLEIVRTPLRLVAAFLFWLLMADVIFSRISDLRPLWRKQFIVGVALTFISVLLLQDYSGSLRDIIVIAIASLPVAVHEEFFYRGIAQNMIVKRVGAKVGIGAATFIFVLYHIGVQELTFVNFYSITAMGLLFGVIYFTTNSMMTIVLYHTIYDAIASGTPLHGQLQQMLSVGMLTLAAAIIVAWSRYSTSP
jgi:membrane protease YdiL (CAAX protease family)